MIGKKRVSHLLLVIIVFSLALTFTAVVQAGGPGQPLPPDGAPSGGPHPPGAPAAAKPPPAPGPANCIDVVAWYDGNFNGVLEGNEDRMDGASIRLMKPYPAPSPAPPIGPDGSPMGPPEGPMAPHAGPVSMRPAHLGPMPVQPGTNDGYAKFQVVDHKLTRDGGVTRFCDLQPGDYILQGDAASGITYGDNRQYIRLQPGGYEVLFFGFTSLDMTPDTLNGDGA